MHSLTRSRRLSIERASKVLILLGVCFWAQSTFGQGVSVGPRTVTATVNGQMRPVVATVTVCASGAAGLPCSPALSNVLFSNAALTQPVSNPTTTDANGNYTFFIAPGNYTLTETASGFSGYSYQTSVTCSPSSCTVGTLTTTGAASVGGTLSVSGFSTFSGGTSLGPRFQQFTANGTFTIPIGVTAVKVTVVAGGGAGGGATNAANTAGGGGGSGGMGIKWLSGLT